jgi:exopolysaccharide production protein ExoY
VDLSPILDSRQTEVKVEAGEVLRRSLDLLLALLALALAWPLFLVISAAVRLDSPGPAFFRQERLGRGGRRFWLLKFRTMRMGAEMELPLLLQNDPGRRLSWEQYGKLWEDPRLTRTGRFLRRYSLDELPQLLNVLRGEMSLVGPRPILPSQREAYGVGFARYSLVRPGLTGLWQVQGRNRTSFAERVRLDDLYLERRSLAGDLSLLLRTLPAVLSGEGAY